MDPKMRQGSRMKALGDIKELMAEGEHQRAKPMFAPEAPAEEAAEPMEMEGMEPEPEGDPMAQLSTEDVQKLSALADLLK